MPCHSKYSVSLGNGLEEAQEVEAPIGISATTAVCVQVKTTGMNEELRDSIDRRISSAKHIFFQLTSVHNLSLHLHNV